MFFWTKINIYKINDVAQLIRGIVFYEHCRVLIHSLRVIDSGTHSWFQRFVLRVFFNIFPQFKMLVVTPF